MRSRTLTAAAVLVFFVVVAAFYTRPLLQERAVRITSDPGDPILNSSVLWWNATTLPFSSAWWTPPVFYPHEGMAALTENLAGISVIATPIFWATHDPLASYNLALFLTWPLSAFAGYLLVRSMTRREDAAIVAGIAYGFAPYRAAQLAHIQVLSSYWFPVALLGLHRFLDNGRRRWLVLFGVAWLLQALANGHFIFYGGVVIGLWLVYFCVSRGAFRQAATITGAWALATLPLLPILWKYKAVHEHYGLTRTMTEIMAFGAQPWAWTNVSNLTWLWPHVLGDHGTETDLFPGAVSLALVALAAVAFVRAQPSRASSDAPDRTPLRRLLLGVAAVTGAVAVVGLVVGPWRTDVLGIRISMSSGGRALSIALTCALAAAFTSRALRDALASRPAGVFYGAMTVLIVVLACGPRVAYGSTVWLDPAPYRWLMMFPGFNELRVPPRIWILGALCLAVAAGLGFARLVSASSRGRWALCAGVSGALLAEVWMPVFPMAPVPQAWPAVERSDTQAAIVELPLGPDYDAAATYRAQMHRRRVVNGVSGYDPPAYAILQAGLKDRDPAMLQAIASFGPIDAVVDHSADPDGAVDRYVSSLAGVQRVASDGTHIAYRLPDHSPVRLGEAWPIQTVQTGANRSQAALAIDGKIETAWVDGPQDPGEWLAVDLGVDRLVGGIEQALGRDLLGFPRRLAIDVSADGQTWRTVWEGGTAGPAFVAAVERPLEIPIRIAFEPTTARFVRLRQIGHFEGGWTVAELHIHAPAPARYP